MAIYFQNLPMEYVNYSDYIKVDWQEKILPVMNKIKQECKTDTILIKELELLENQITSHLIRNELCSYKFKPLLEILQSKRYYTEGALKGAYDDEKKIVKDFAHDLYVFIRGMEADERSNAFTPDKVDVNNDKPQRKFETKKYDRNPVQPMETIVWKDGREITLNKGEFPLDTKKE